MDDQIIKILIPVIGLVSGLIATYVSLQNRALLAEVRKELAELENKLISKMNGTYIRRSECELRELLIQEKLGAVLHDIQKKAADGQ